MVLAALFALSACTNSATVGTVGPSSPAPYAPRSAPASGSSPTPPATAGTPPSSGPRTASCVKGWVSPKPGSSTYKEALRIIQNTVPVKGKVSVVEMRYFVGPESPPSTQPESLRVARWYVRLYAVHDITYQGRFLVEKRVFGSGVAAVAPYDTRGYASPDWTGFQWDAGNPTRKAYPGLPGRWAGTRYDFVKGGQGMRIIGLPDAVIGCLDGT